MTEGRSVQRLREALGWTRIGLAAESGVSRHTIYALETGWRGYRAKMTTLEKLGRALGVTPADLVSGSIETAAQLYEGTRQDAEDRIDALRGAESREGEWTST